MEHRNDSQQMDFRNDLKLRCPRCRVNPKDGIFVGPEGHICGS
jgi:hypothetical protein